MTTKKINPINIFLLSSDELNAQTFDYQIDNVIFIVEDDLKNGQASYVDFDTFINEVFLSRKIKDILFISGKDAFAHEKLKQSLTSVYQNNLHKGLTLLVPYLPPPVTDTRTDGKVNSFIVAARYCTPEQITKHAASFWKLVYAIAYPYLNSDSSENMEIIQVGKPVVLSKPEKERVMSMLKKSLLLIPHKGSLKLLYRCLFHLNQQEELPGNVKISFDDNSYKRFIAKTYHNIKNRLKMSVNEPLSLGPYLGRHYSIMDTDSDYIFFQDSDDISVHSRFEKQLEALKSRNLDMIGSHELRVDQYKKCLLMIRFPLDANYAFSLKAYQPMFHPTGLITRNGYLKTKGFSTDQTFGYDLQLTMRADFLLKIGNIDDFLYIRFKRPGSLTTHHKTKLGSDRRSFLWWRWRVDMRLVSEEKLNLEDSSLWVQRHEFDYRMIDIPVKQNE